MNKKALINLDTFLIALALFGLVITVCLVAVSDMVKDYKDQGIDITFEENASVAFDKAAEIDAQTSKIQNAFENSSSGICSALGPFVCGAWAALTSTKDSIGLTKDVVQGSLTEIGMPPVVWEFLVVAIAITILITLAYIAMGSQVR